MIDLTRKLQSIQQSENPESYSEEGVERLKEQLQNYEGEDKLVWWEQILEEIQNEPEKTLHKTGLGELDNIIGGFMERQLAIVAGDSGHGKTSMGIFLLHCLKELNPIMIPLEQSADELIRQRIQNGHEVPTILSPHQLAKAVTTEWIEERIVEGIAKYNTKVVLIDHLGYIDNYGADGKLRRENLAYRVGEVMRDLKGIAKRWDVIILLLVHISQHDEGQPPSRQDIKNSSDIIQESDMGIFVWRKNEVRKKVRVYDDKTLISVQKNRRTGKNGSVGLCFNRATGWYGEEHEWVKQMEDTARQQIAFEEDDDF